jgi:hypothetical protein
MADPERVVAAQEVVIGEMVRAVFGVWVTSNVVAPEKAEATLLFLADQIEKTDYALGFRKDGPDPAFMREFARNLRVSAAQLREETDGQNRRARQREGTLTDRLQEPADEGRQPKRAQRA